MQPTEPISKGRKAPTRDVLLDNAMGMSMSTIAYRYKVAPSSIAHRLKQEGVAPADTRRAFMDSVLSDLPLETFEWLRSQVTPAYSIKQLVADALKSLHQEKTHDLQNQDCERPARDS